MPCRPDCVVENEFVFELLEGCLVCRSPVPDCVLFQHAGQPCCDDGKRTRKTLVKPAIPRNASKSLTLCRVGHFMMTVLQRYIFG